MIVASDVVWVGLAGAAGAVARYGADTAVKSRTATTFPVGTMAINVSGSLLLGLLTGLVLYHGVTPTLTVVAGTGFCGGYTTFSTASFETVRLLQQHRTRAAAVCGLGTLGGTLLAGALGLALAGLL